MGALLNFASVIVGGLIGLILKKKIKENLTEMLITVMALSLIFVAITGIIPTMIKINNNKLEAVGVLCLILSVFIGSLIGYALKINDNLDRFGGWIEKKMNLANFSTGFITATLFFCVGAMGILASIQEGVEHKYDIFFCKAIIDFVTSMAFTASLGYGVIFSSIPILLYEGGLTLAAKNMQSILQTPLGNDILSGVCMVGYLIIFAIALNMMKIKKIKCGDLLPAMFVPILYYIVVYFIKSKIG
ncbi:MAG: DUF554 domain-containing protein [Bacillales bacterium]